jgi:hypothetical protein
VAAVLFAACTGGSPAAAPTGSSAGSAATTAPSPGHSGTPSPVKPTKHGPPPKPRHRPRPFRFRIANVGHTLTTGKLGPVKVHRATVGSAQAIQLRFTNLFRMTYVDPSSWKPSKYGEAFQRFFGGQVRAAATEHRQKLTLGPDAGQRFASVWGPVGTLKVKVLIGAEGGPVTALVRARFTEKAVRTNGGTTVVVSDGTYYVQPSKGGWTIQAFQVGRHDHPL